MLGDNTKDKLMQDFAVPGYSDAVNALKELQCKVLSKSDSQQHWHAW